METVLCPSGQQVTKEDCEQCGQCRPSPMIKYADEIVKEIEQRGVIKIPNGNVSGEEFEKWLYEEDTKIKNKDTIK